MYDHDIEERLRSGGTLTGLGIFILVASFIGTCMASMAAAGEPDSMNRSFEIGQSPWLLIGMGLGITFITLGQVRKSNARREAERRYLEANTRVDVVLDQESPDGPFRGDMREVEVLDPVVAEMHEAERSREHRRGTVYLSIGGAIIAVTLVGVVMVIKGGADSHRAAENMLAAVGLSVFPFGFGLFFAIKGALLRSK